MGDFKLLALVLFLVGCNSTPTVVVPTEVVPERHISTNESYVADVKELIRQRNELHAKLSSIARYDLQLPPSLRDDIYCFRVRAPDGIIPVLSPQHLALSDSHEETEAVLTAHIVDLRLALKKISKLVNVANESSSACMDKYLNDG